MMEHLQTSFSIFLFSFFFLKWITQLHSPLKDAFVWDIPEQEYIPEYIPAILLLGAEEPEWKSRYSGMRIAPKQTLTRIIPIILIPD